MHVEWKATKKVAYQNGLLSLLLARGAKLGTLHASLVGG
jgi:hypothetical protein